MNYRLTTKTVQRGLCAGLLLGATLAARATVNVTFQVDMTAGVNAGTFVPGTTNYVEARGAFQGWSAGFQLTNNPSAINTNIYSGVATISDAPGTVENYKFVVNGGSGPIGWEGGFPTSTGNRQFTLGSSGTVTVVGGVTNEVLSAVYFNNTVPPGGTPTNYTVTFQVDMTAGVAAGKFVPGTDYVEARGSFQGWGAGFQLTNNPSASNTNIYSGVTTITDVPGTVEQYKFVVDGGGGTLGWESPASTGGNNREFSLGSPNGVVQVVSGTGVTNEVLPAIYFNDLAPASNLVTNSVTFQVDLTVAVIKGNFVPGSDIVEARGSFQGWSGGFGLTNNPNTCNTNVYSGVFTITDAPGTVESYKFVVDAGNGPLGWEEPASTGGNNRQFKLANTNAQTLPNVYFNDLALNDVSATDTLATFTVNMTGAVGTDGHVFDTNTDTVYLNGVYNGIPGSFWGWSPLPPPQYAMTNYPVGSSNYTLQVLIPAGNPLLVDYKYGINGNDDEAGFANNHNRYIRQLGNYTMPTDTFGNQLVEPSFGNLAVKGPSGGSVPVTWLGRPGVHLQTKTSLSSGAWVDHPETDALSATNWPVGNGNLFFRLVKPAAQAGSCP